jgi:hypothetical protein
MFSIMDEEWLAGVWVGGSKWGRRSGINQITPTGKVRGSGAGTRWAAAAGLRRMGTAEMRMISVDSAWKK